MLVVVVPMEAHGIFAYRRNLIGLDRRLEHRERIRVLRLGIARQPVLLDASIFAEGTRASIAQPAKGVVAVMPVFPVDIHAGPGRDVDAHVFRLNRQSGRGLQLRPLILMWRHTLSI